MTASLLARDPDTGDMGIATVAAMMNVGALVPTAEAGVGVVASQASADASFGPLGMELMRGGLSAGDALHALLAVDELRARRQVLMLDSDGGVAVHTGEACVGVCSERAGPEVVAASSSLARAVADQMVDAFLAAEGDLAARLVAGLAPCIGAEGAMPTTARSASLTVVRGAMTGRPWDDVLWDLRVDEHAAPVIELARLLELKRGFRRMFIATGKAMMGDPDSGMEVFGALDEAFPTALDFTARKALLLAMVGRIDEARVLCRRLVDDGAGWRAALQRQADAGLLPEGLVAALFDDG